MNKIPQTYYSFSKPSTLKEILIQCSENGDLPAFQYSISRHELETISYKQFASDVEALGTWLLTNNHKNTNIALIGENSYKWIISYFSIACGGNVVVPLDKELQVKDIHRLTTDGDCTLIIYDDSQQEKMNQLKEISSSLTYINMSELPGYISSGQQLLNDGSKVFSEVTISEDDLASIVYTSGTTGLNKGVMLSHKNMCASAIGTSEIIYFKDRTVVALPLNHAFGFVPGILVPLIQKSMIFINNKLRNLLNDIQTAKPITLCLVPLFVESFYNGIWYNAEKNGYADALRERIKQSKEKLSRGIDDRRTDFKDIIDSFGGYLHTINCGGAPINSKYVDGFADFGIYITCGYGLTECGPVVSANAYQNCKYGSVGQVLSCNKVMIKDPDSDGMGEILVQGNNVMKGYYKNDEANAQVFENGWFKTGDLGYLDEDGFVYVTGRIKNLIILSNGKNVSPEELENSIQNLSYVKEVLVSSEDNYIVANVFLDYEACPDANEQIKIDIDKINASNPHYKKIEKIVIRETEFEKTSTNKIRRNL